jgi:hypothetical protein
VLTGLKVNMQVNLLAVPSTQQTASLIAEILVAPMAPHKTNSKRNTFDES